MKKIITTFSIVVICLFLLSVFGWMVNQIGTGQKKFGFMTEPIKFMYSFPDLFKQSVKEINTLPQTFIRTPDGFTPLNKLENDLFVLTTFSENDSTRAIAVRNLRNDSILKQWSVRNRHYTEARIFHPLYLPDGSIVYSFGYTWDGLERIDSAGNVMWQQKDVLFHHGMELNKDGDIWACTKQQSEFICGTIKILNSPHYYMDYTISKIDVETGEILFHKSISDILKENNLQNYILKCADLKDPFHLNDVQPALRSTDFYLEDDVFISLRTISCIIHYRPSTNEVIRVIEGPFVSQHDVDFINDHTLCVFNNNLYQGTLKNAKESPKDNGKLTDIGDFYSSSVVSYDLITDQFAFIGDSIFKANEIYTASEGLQEFIDERTFFVEEQNSGILWVIKNDEVVYKDVFRSHHKGHHHLPNWNRVIDFK